jgi:hypothetical protein
VVDLGSAAIVSIKMASMKEKAQCAFGFMKRNCHLQFGEISDVSMDEIRQMLKASQVGWYTTFKETGNVGDCKRTGRSSVSEETIDAVRDAFQRSPRK